MLSTVVPINTNLADLDESVRNLVRRELERNGFEGLDVVFDAPTREWAATLSKPTVSVFLYDIREAKDARLADWYQEPGQEVRPPLRVDATFAVTAWTREVQDEHRLLSQVLTILYAFPELPDEILHATLKNGGQPYPLRTRVAQPRQEGGADFWSAVGGQYKASIDYTVTLSFVPGTVFERGPEVRTQTLRFRQSDGTDVLEVHWVGGRIRDAEGIPVADAWIVLPDAGRWAVSDSDGRFRLDRVAAGTHTIIARTAAGGEVKGEITAPGKGIDLVIGAATARKAR